PGNFRVIQPASTNTVGRHSPTMKVGVLAGFFGMVGFFLAAAAALGREFFDSRLKTEDDVARVTRLPIIATLGDTRKMSEEEREDWAFRTWISLQNRLSFSPNHGLICGFTSSNEGEGRSTWISLLAGAARKYGFRVLTIATRSADGVAASAEEVEKQVAQEAERAAARESRVAAVNGAQGINGHTHAGGVTAVAEPGTGRTSTMLTHPDEFGHASRSFNSNSDFTSLTASALFTPAVVTEKLTGPESDPLVHIPLPGWTWNLERRKQWQGALNVWRKIDNVVILVELPPASMPESVLLASNLPNLVWVAESGKSEAATTRAQLETLRNARCNIVGAVINRALKPVTEGKFSRWVAAFALFAAVQFNGGFESTAYAQAAATPVAATAEAGATSFGVSSPAQRAKWQQKLTLGPGDVLSFNLFGNPEGLRQDVRVGPDGRISYLEAQNVRAAGLTVDEFREEMNKELSKYRRAPQVFVVPVSYNSKKYFVLGRVAQRGAFPLDRPITLIEAVARAGGLETGMAADRSLVELADLSRSFIARDNKRLPVNFEKLFLEGDLSQNIPLEPNDYIYFPGGSEKEVFVLGAVKLPGAHTYHTTIGVLGAIAGRGGFNERAWQSKLLVIRGGLGRPETIEIDAFDVLSGKKPDIQLKPRDIVYVADRPWIYGEQLLDAAADAFVTAAVVTWTGEKVTRD
ncbi:MAG TPA: polysaccharide biosynthesis/export family protein, partial [Opitutaceae bacterium]